MSMERSELWKIILRTKGKCKIILKSKQVKMIQCFN